MAGTEQQTRRPFLTLRVSRDSGRTWEPTKRFFAAACRIPITSTWPPCACPRCTQAAVR